MILVLCILCGTVVLFVSNLLRVDMVAFLVLVALGVTRLLSPEQLFSGFSSEAVISLIAVMIIGAGLEQVGISTQVARWMLHVGKDRPKTILLLLMSVSGVLAGFMRSLGTAALFLPIINRLSARTGISKGYLLLPVAFCALVGGTLTMVGTGPLILLNSLLSNASEYIHYSSEVSFAPFKLFAVLPIGLILLIGSIGYLFLIGSRWLPGEKSGGFQSSTSKAYFKKTYNKGGDIIELKVSSNSPFVDGTLKDMEVKLPENLAILAIEQNNNAEIPPLRKSIIKANSSIAIMGPKEDILEYAKTYKLKPLPALKRFAEKLHPVKAGLCEVVIPPSSQLIGKLVNELHMRRNHGLHVLALYRGQVIQGEELKKLTLRSGDVLGIYSEWDDLHDFKANPDFAVLTSNYPREKSAPKKLPHALFFFGFSIFTIIFDLLPLSVGLLLGAAGMIATGVLSIDEAYAKVSWKTVFLLAGLLPLGLVMQTTGTTEWLIDQLLFTEKPFPTWFYLAALSIITTAFSLVISNIGATILMVPIAFDLALNIGADPRMFALTVALAATNTFLIPTHQVNALIAGPGNYQLKDFLKVGGVMTVWFWIMMLLVIPLMFRFVN